MAEERTHISGPDQAAVAATSAPPSSPPGYELRDEIGHGGMGVVYRARDVALDRDVAVKLLSERYPADSPAAQRFLNEARITGQLQHPGIPAVHQVGTLADGRPFLAMKLIKGSTLEVILKQRPSPLPLSPEGREEAGAERGRLLAIFEAVCQAVGYAHAYRVIHRDLKPANIMVGAFGEVQVMDWGLAKVLGEETPATADALAAEETQAWTQVSPTPESSSHTQAGSLIGTPAFIAPEQAGGEIERVNERSDVFGLGALLAVILTGKPPYVGETFESVRVQALRGKLEDCFARLDACDVEPELVALCKKCLAFEPADRPADAGAVAAAVAGLRAAADERARQAELERVQAEGETREALARAAEQRRRRRILLTASGIIALVFLVGFAAAFWQWRVAETARADEKSQRDRAEQSRQEQERTHLALEDAKKQRALTAEAQHQSQQLSARLALERGLSLCQQGHTGQGLLWMARSLEIAPEADPDLERDIRSNVARWRTSLHRLQAVWHTPCPLESLAVSPDGKLFLTGGTDGRPRLWDTASGKLVLELPQHQGETSALEARVAIPGVFSPDGKTLLTGGDGFKAQLWDVASGKPLGPPLEHQAVVRAVAFSPDGKTIVTGSEDGTARVWDAAGHTPLGAVMHHQGWVMAVAFSPNGKLILTGSRDQTARLWEAGTGKPIGAPLVHQGIVQAVAFAPDGNTIVTGVNVNVAQRWDVATHKPKGEPLVHQDDVYSVAYSPDGKIIATGSRDKTLRLWEAQTGKPLLPVLSHGGPVRAVAFTPDGKSVLTASADQTVRLWEVGTGDPFGTPLRHQGIVMAVAFSPDGKTVLTGSIDKTARLWDAATGRELRQFRGHQGGVWAVAYSPDGKTILTGSSDGTARLWNVGTGEPINHALEYDFAGGMTLAFSPNGKIVAATSAEEVRLWDAATGQPIGPPHLEGPSFAVAFSPDGSRLLAGSQTGTGWLLDSATGKSLRILTPPHHGRVDAVAFSPDGRTCLTASADATVKLWETASGKAIGQPMQHRVAEAGWFSVAFSPDSKTVATGGEDEIAHLWDAATGAPIGQPMRHQGKIWAVAFSPDGKMLLTGSVDGTVRLWDAATGKPIGTPLQHPGRVRAVVFSPDGKKIATACGDNTARLWELPAPVPGDLERIVLWAQVVTGMKLDDDGAIQVLDSDTWHQLRQRLDELCGPPVR